MDYFAKGLRNGAKLLGFLGPMEQAEEMARLGNEYGKKMNETEPCVCGHGKPFHYYKNCSPQLAEKYQANGFPDGACHMASADRKFPAKCGCVGYQRKGEDSK